MSKPGDKIRVYILFNLGTQIAEICGMKKVMEEPPVHRSRFCWDPGYLPPAARLSTGQAGKACLLSAFPVSVDSFS